MRLRAKDRKWLETIQHDTDHPLGMYAGSLPNVIPEAPALRLRLAGLIYEEYPHNPAHKHRLCITEEGRAALGEEQESQG